jgi:hypothetical protein
MTIRDGFVSDNSSSFILKKGFMGDDELKDYHMMQEKSDKYDSFGETENFLFGIVANDTEFYKWFVVKRFIGIEWGV